MASDYFSSSWQPRRVNSLREVSVQGAPSGITEKIETSFVETADGVRYVAGAQEAGVHRVHQHAGAVRGAYHVEHGLLVNGQNTMGSPMVQRVGDPATAKTPWMSSGNIPSFDPNSGLRTRDWNGLATAAARNARVTAGWLRKAEAPVGCLVVANCNSSADQRATGIGPDYWSHLAGPQFKHFAMASPGFVGLATSQQDPLGCNRGADVNNLPQEFRGKVSPNQIGLFGLRFFEKSDGVLGIGKGFKDKGLFVSNRTHDAYIPAGLTHAHLEALEANQWGKGYRSMVAAAFNSRDSEAIAQTLAVRPTLAKSYETYCQARGYKVSFAQDSNGVTNIESIRAFRNSLSSEALADLEVRFADQVAHDRSIKVHDASITMDELPSYLKPDLYVDSSRGGSNKASDKIKPRNSSVSDHVIEAAQKAGASAKDQQHFIS